MFLNRLTFRLMSLIVLFTLMFATTTVIAEPGGPTVTIAQGTSKTRADFDLTFTFSHPVEAAGVTTGTLAFTWQLVDAQSNLLDHDAVTDGVNPATGSAEQKSGSRTVYEADINITVDSDLDLQAVKVIVSVAADIKTGTTTANSRQNQAAKITFDLPPVQGEATVEVSAEEIANQPGGYTVTFTFSEATSSTFTQANISIPATGVTLSSFSVVTTDTVFSVEAQLTFGASGIRVGVAPGYAAPTSPGSNFVTLPLPPPTSPVRERPPVVDIEIGDYTAEPRAFRIDITFIPQSKSDGTDGDDVMVDKDTFHEHAAFVVKDSFDRNSDLTKVDASSSVNSYAAILQYGPLVIGNLPLTISIDPNDLDEKYNAVDADPDATPPDPGVPDVDAVTAMYPPEQETPPPSGITFSQSQFPNQTFVAGTPITPVFLPMATGGTPPYTYTLAPLPTGLVFTAATQELSGTPTVAGTTTTTYTVTDAADMTATLTFTIAVLSADTPSVIPDTSLAAAIRRSLSLAANTPLTAAVMADLTDLNAYNSGVARLDGLQQATNLTTLDLGMNRITNISVLSGMTQLTHLYLDDNQITNVSALSGLRNLRLLRLAGNSIEDTSPLATLIDNNPGLDLDIPPISPDDDSVTFADENLKTAVRIALRMTENETITEESMLNLFFLEAYDRRIESIQGLEHATNMIALDLGKNAIVDVSPLSGLTQLQILFLDDNQISDVSPLASLTQLDLLFLTGNPISSLAPIEALIGGIQIFRSKAEQ